MAEIDHEAEAGDAAFWPPRTRPAIGLFLLLLTALGLGTWALRNRLNHGAGPPLAIEESEDSDLASTGTPPEGYTADLAALCHELTEGRHPELGRQPLQDLKKGLDALEARPSDRGGSRDYDLADAHIRLAEELVSQNELDEAFLYYKRARDLLRTIGQDAIRGDPRFEDLDYRQAAAHLRAGETANCVDGDNPFICLLSRGSQGIYSERAHSLAAIELLQAFLNRQPSHLGARWLLNLAYMTIGLHPEGVPERWRIAAEVFASQRDAPRMVDIARSSGVAPNNLLGGAVMDDFDGDGRLDLFTTTYEPCSPPKLYRNRGDGRFVDRSDAAGLGDQLGGFNTQQTDYDNDGDLDLFITRGAWQHGFGRQRNSLLRNEGDGSFIDVTHAAGLADPAYPTQASAWADYDGDGDLDLYIGNERIGERHPFPSQLFRNEGDGRFTDVAESARVDNRRFAKGVAWGDYDNDGDADLYVSNIGPNRLYRNDGKGIFTDVAPELGLLRPDRSFATWFWDYDNDGWLDLYVAAYDASIDQVVADYLGQANEGLRPKLYRNDGRGGFEDVTETVGLDQVRLPMGANHGDLDGDGWLDIYLGTGDPDLATVLPNVMYLSEQGERFVDVTAAAGLGHLPKGHGVAFGDIDADGDEDLYLQAGGFVPGDANPNALFQNPGSGNRWLTLRLRGRTANRPAIMARVRVEILEAGRARRIYGMVSSGGSFGANSLQQEIGLGQAEKIIGLSVWWPGSEGWQDYPPVALDQIVRLEQGRAEAEIVDQAALRLESR